jgi:hypothetical protein
VVLVNAFGLTDAPDWIAHLFIEMFLPMQTTWGWHVKLFKAMLENV